MLLTANALDTHPAGVSSYVAASHIPPDAWYTSTTNGRVHPLWLTSSILRYAAKRAAIRAAVAELDAQVTA